MWQVLPEPRVLEEVGKRVRALRLAQGLSQEILAREAGLSLPTIQRLERGQVKSQLESLVRVLRALRKLDELEAMLAPPPVSPIALAAHIKPPRKRAPRKTNGKPQRRG